MDFGKLSNGMKLALIGGAVTVVALFLPWYGFLGFNINAFDSGFLAWGGSLIAIAGAVVLLLKALGTTEVSLGDFKAEQVAVALGGLGFVLVLLRWITESNLTRFGLFLGILGSAAVAAGAFLAMREAGLGMPGMSSGGGGAAAGTGTTPSAPPSAPDRPTGGAMPPEGGGGYPGGGGGMPDSGGGMPDHGDDDRQ
jgi:hypothetical protein